MFFIFILSGAKVLQKGKMKKGGLKDKFLFENSKLQRTFLFVRHEP